MSGQTLTRSTELSQAQTSTLRNAYIALAATFAVAAGSNVLAIMSQAEPVNWILQLVVSIGLIIGIAMTRNSALGLVLLMIFGAFEGYTLAPIIQQTLAKSTGAEVLTLSLVGAIGLFSALSAYTVKSGKDFRFLGGFLFAGLIVTLLIGIAAAFMDIGLMSSAFSWIVLLLMCGFTLYDTSKAIHDPNANYIMIATGFFLNILNMFLSLLNIADD